MQALGALASSFFATLLALGGFLLPHHAATPTPASQPATVASAVEQPPVSADPFTAATTSASDATMGTIADSGAMVPIVHPTYVTITNPVQQAQGFAPLSLVGDLAQELAALAALVHLQLNPASFPQQVAAGGASYGGGGYVPGPSLAINQLQNTTITNPTITGGSVAASSITGTITNAINAAASTIENLTTTQLTATNGTSTTFYVTGPLTVAGTSTLATTTVSGDLTVSGTITGGTLSVSGLSSGGAVAAPYFTATSTTATSSFAGPVTFSALTSGLVYANGSGVLSSVATSTWSFASSTLLEDSNSWSSLQQFNNNASTTQFTSTGSAYLATGGGNVGIGTTSPFALLSVAGSGFFNGNLTGANLTATGTLAVSGLTTLGNASTTQLSVSNSAYFPGSGVWNSSGNVGIGTTGPIDKLDVKMTTDEHIVLRGHQNFSSGATISSLNDANSAFKPLEFQASSFDFTQGNVGIGTTGPGYPLDVAGAVNTRTLLHFGGNSETGFTSADHPVLYSTGAGGAAYPFQTAGNLVLQSRTSGAARDIVFVGNTTPAAQMVIQGSTGNVGIGTTTPASALDVNGVIRATNYPAVAASGQGVEVGFTGGYGQINSYNRSGGAFVPLRIDGSSISLNSGSNGNVGIGTTSPAVKLQVSGGGIRLDNNKTIGWYNSDGTGLWTGITQNTSNNLLLSNNNAQMVLTGVTGNVGIGTTSPQAKLHVHGTVGSPKFVVSDSDRQWSLYTGASAPGYLELRDDTSGNIRLAVTTAGNVGIGTTTPSSQLQIKNATNQETQIGGTAGAYDNSTYFTDLFRVDSAINFSRSTDGAFLNSIFGYETAGLAENNLGLVARHDIKFVVGATADRGMVIKSTGNVGIGTTSPGALLDVAGTINSAGLNVAAAPGTAALISRDRTTGGVTSLFAKTPILQLTGDGSINNGPGLALLQLNIGAASLWQSASELYLAGTRSTTAGGARVAVADGDILGKIGFFGDDGTDLRNRGAIIQSMVDASTDAVATGAIPSDIAIATAKSTPIRFLTNAGVLGGALGTTNERMRISGNGNVGIGTTGPGAKLVVNQSADAVSAVDSNDGFALYNQGTLRASLTSDASYTYLQTWDSKPLQINNQGNNVILGATSGNVGIGTTGPGERLTVSQDQDAQTRIALSNQNSGSSAQSTLRLSTYGAYWDIGSGSTANNSNALTVGITGSEKMRIDASGNVGIGTTAPGGDATNRQLTVLGSNSGQITASNGSVVTNLGINSSNLGYVEVSGANPLGLYTNSTERVRIDSSGNVGIGTTAPVATLDVSTNTAFTYAAAATAGAHIGARGTGSSLLVNTPGLNTSYASGLAVDGSYSSLISTVNLKAFGTYSGGGYGSNMAFYTSNNTTLSERMRITSSGNVGIGTTSPALKLQVNGNIGPNTDNTYTDGTATYRWSAVYAANGTIQTSDARLKSNVTDLNYGLADLMKLHPVSFTWTSNPEQGTKLGFIAQEVQGVMPEVVNTGDDANHTLGITYTEFIPTIVKALQQLSTQLSTLRDTVAGMADRFATRELSFDRAAGDTMTLKTLCLSDANGTSCYTRSQLDSFVQSQGAAQTAAAASTQGANATPATLTLNGNATSTIALGASYNDLGATFTHSGITETIYATSTVDASVAGTTTLDYWATWYPDPAATTSAETLHTVREVVVTDPNAEQGNATNTTQTATSTGQ